MMMVMMMTMMTSRKMTRSVREVGRSFFFFASALFSGLAGQM